MQENFMSVILADTQKLQKQTVYIIFFNLADVKLKWQT